MVLIAGRPIQASLASFGPVQVVFDHNGRKGDPRLRHLPL